MRSRVPAGAGRVEAPAPRAAIRLLLAILALALAAGCGGTGRSDRDSSVQREEQRPYGHVVLRSELAPKRATLGDPIVWTLSAELPEGTQPGDPSIAPAPHALEIEPQFRRPTRSARGTVLWSRRFTVRAFDLGAIPLPAAVLPVVHGAGERALPDTLYFPSDSLAIDSLTTAITGNVEPDRGPIDPGLRGVDVAVAVALAIVVAALLAALLILWRRRRGREAAAGAAAAVVAPEEPYRRALEALRAEGADLPRDVFHERLSEAIRRYVSDVAGVDAIDRTTRELERELRESGRARPDAAAEITRILKRSDLVKFARREDAWTEARALLDDAERLAGRVAAARAALPAAPPAAEPGGAE